MLSAAHFNSCYFLIHLFIFIFLNKNLIFWKNTLKKKDNINLFVRHCLALKDRLLRQPVCQNTRESMSLRQSWQGSHKCIFFPFLTYYLSLPTPFLCLFFLHFAFSPSWRNVIHICIPHFCNNHISNICGYIPLPFFLFLFTYFTNLLSFLSVSS